MIIRKDVIIISQAREKQNMSSLRELNLWSPSYRSDNLTTEPRGISEISNRNKRPKYLLFSFRQCAGIFLNTKIYFEKLTVEWHYRIGIGACFLELCGAKGKMKFGRQNLGD